MRECLAKFARQQACEHPYRVKSAMSEMIDYSLNGNVAHIRLQNGKANAFSQEFTAAINAALDQAEKDEAAVLFIGNPGLFSAGFDLKVVQSGDKQAIANMMVDGGTLCARLLEFPRPVVAAVTGHCMAQGVMMLMACDYSIAADGKFTLGMNETQIGIVMPQYAVELAKGRFQKNLWQRVVTQAELYDPKGALELGLIDGVVAEDDLLEAAATKAQQLAELDKRAFKRNKQLMRAELIEAMHKALAVDGDNIISGVAG